MVNKPFQDLLWPICLGSEFQSQKGCLINRLLCVCSTTLLSFGVLLFLTTLVSLILGGKNMEQAMGSFKVHISFQDHNML